LPRKEQRGGLGRRLAIGIYAIVFSYLVIVGFASVIPQVFWPEADESFDLECADGLQLLRHEVDQLKITYVSTNETNPVGLQNALESWDLRLNALARRCDEDQVYALRQYRYRAELSLERYMREEAPIANRVSEMEGSLEEEPGAAEPAP
jgi:hypothetical protein